MQEVILPLSLLPQIRWRTRGNQTVHRSSPLSRCAYKRYKIYSENFTPKEEEHNLLQAQKPVTFKYRQPPVMSNPLFSTKQPKLAAKAEPTNQPKWAEICAKRKWTSLSD